MGKIEGAVKSEIVRLARRELRAVCGPLSRDVRALKRTVSQLGKAVTSFQKVAAAYVKETRERKARLQVSQHEVKAARLSAGLIQSLRKRLGLSQGQLGVFVGVSPATIGFWEQGRTRPSDENKVAIVALRKLGKREVKGILAQKAPKEPKKTRAKRKKRQKKVKRRR
jgi:DNA-binding transcriptional regulator YiaG